MLMICVQLCSPTADSFQVSLNDDDPFKFSQDFVRVQIGQDLQLTGSDAHMYSGILPLESAIRSCVDSGVLTNLFVFTATDGEFKTAIRNVS